MTRRIRIAVATALAIALIAGGGALAGASLAPRQVAPASFPDVPGGAFYAAAVQWALDNGITTGVGDTGLYQPEANVTRGQMATFLNRLASTDVVLNHAPIGMVVNTGNGGTMGYFATTARADGDADGSSGYMLPVDGPEMRNGIEYGMQSLEYCIDRSSNSGDNRIVSTVFAWSLGPGGGLVSDGTDRTADGCYTIEVGRPGPLQVNFIVSGTQGSVGFTDFTSTWVPTSELVPAELAPADLSDPSVADMLGG